MRAIALACLIGTVMVFSGITGAHGIGSPHSEGYIIDVIVVDLDCEENLTCVSRPSNIIEYFGADWCTECPEVEDQLNNTSDNQSIILSHRPSTSDDFWLEDSRKRFLETYGLWGYPTIVVDGHYALAGPTQSRELDSLLSESISNYSGITNVSMVNDSLYLEGNFTGLSIDVWTVKSNDKVPNVAINHTNLTETNIVDLDGEKLVIVVSYPGYIHLIPGSSMPVNDYSPDTGLDEIEERGESVKGSTIIIITVLLAMICLPATVTLIQIIREPTPENEIQNRKQYVTTGDANSSDDFGNIKSVNDESE